jgi:ice-binding like protein
MIRLISALRPVTRAAVLLPLTLLVSACSDSDTPDLAAGASGAGGSALGGAAGSSGASGNGSGGSSGVGNGGGGSSGVGNGGGGSSGVGNGGGGDAGETDSTVDGDAESGAGPALVPLGTAGDFVILAKTAISNVPTSTITGDLGLSPNAASALTGFSVLTDTGPYWTSSEVVGSLFAADGDVPTPSLLSDAVLDMEAAYTDAAGRLNPDFLDLETGDIGGQTLTPGLYRWASTVNIPSDVTLSGGANDVWIFQISDDLTLGAAQSMILQGGAQAKNVFWQVAGTVSFGATSHSEGIFMSQTAITLGAGAAVNGRLFAQSAVTLASNAVTEPDSD